MSQNYCLQFIILHTVLWTIFLTELICAEWPWQQLMPLQQCLRPPFKCNFTLAVYGKSSANSVEDNDWPLYKKRNFFGSSLCNALYTAQNAQDITICTSLRYVSRGFYLQISFLSYPAIINLRFHIKYKLLGVFCGIFQVCTVQGSQIVMF